MLWGLALALSWTTNATIKCKAAACKNESELARVRGEHKCYKFGSVLVFVACTTMHFVSLSTCSWPASLSTSQASVLPRRPPRYLYTFLHRTYAGHKHLARMGMGRYRGRAVHHSRGHRACHIVSC